MNRTFTPLRYPGGKSKMGRYIASIMRANQLFGAAYAEPYAGGAGAGLYLLFGGYTSQIFLNDVDGSVVDFWKAVLKNPEKFARNVEKVPLNVPEWDRQKQALTSGNCFDRGFAFFYLNRTNRSGIMNGGIIGGRAQAGDWKLDARFNRTELARRIRALGSVRRKIDITCSDALLFLDGLSQSRGKVFTYLDPPYFFKGRELYRNYYSVEDHSDIARYLENYRHPWIMTYDACPQIRQLYSSLAVMDCELSYSAREVRRGSELLIFGPKLDAPSSGPHIARWRAGFEIKEQSTFAA